MITHTLARRISALLLAFALTVFALAVPARADLGVLVGPVLNPANGHTYYLLDQSNWTDAEATALGLGGHLVTVNNAEEDGYIFDTFSHFDGVERGLWIGLNDAANEGTFVWADGEPVTYTNWNAAQPDNSGDEDYVHLFQTGVPGFTASKWNDLPNVTSAGGTVPVLNGVVEVDTSTDTPILTEPTADTTYYGSVPVSFTLPEAALPGSVQLKFHDFPNLVEVELQLTADNETAGDHSLSIDAANPGASPGVQSVLTGGAIVDGTYSVIVSYQDTLGNDRAYAFNFNVTVYSSLTPAGYYSATGYGPGTPADPGYYVPLAGSTAQIPCDPGYYQPNAGAIAQIPAAPGNYVPLPAAIAQTQCEPGYYQPDPAQSSQLAAQPGFYVPNFGAIFAIPADPGYYVPNFASTASTACDPGYYQPNFGAFMQIPADPGYYVPVFAAVGQIPADPGNYVEFQASAVQTPCSPGHFQPSPAQSFQLPTPLGTYAPGLGAIQPILADPGYYVPIIASFMQFPCDPGYYQPNSGASQAIAADPGYYVPNATAIEQIPAPRGYYVPFSAATASIPGDAGFYVPLPASSAQTPNPPGTYSHIASYVVRSAPTPRDGTTIVSPIYFSYPADGTIALGAISAATEVDIAVQNVTPDGPSPDSLTDLGITGVDFGGSDAANLSVSEALPGVIVAGPAFPTFHERLAVDPGANGQHSATVTIKTDQNAEPGGVGLEHVYTITWEVVGPLTDPTRTLLYGKGDTVPAAGTDSRIPSGAVFTGFGVPAINNDAKVAFVGKWKPATGGNAGIFVHDELIVAKGDAVPDLVDTTFVSFKDPAINFDGRVTFLAKISGPGITPANSTGLFTNTGNGTLRLVVQKGTAAPGIPGATIKNLVSFTFPALDVFYTATLVQGVGGVTSTDDTALWGWHIGTATLLVREGNDIGGDFGKPVKSFVALKPGSGSLGHGRSTVFTSTVVRAIFADGTQAIRAFDVVQHSDPIFTTADSAPTLTGVTLTKFGLASLSDDENAVVLAKLTGSGVSSATGQAIITSSGTLAFRKGDEAPELPGLTLAGFKDPVTNEGGDIAAPVTLGATDSNKKALVWLAGGTPHTVGRIGSLAADTLGGETWKAFKNLALPDNLGPVFTATLLQGTGGVSATNDVGLWGVTSIGTTRLLLREGGTVGSKTVKSFKVLASVSGSPDQRRAFNGAKQIVTVVTFTDGTNGLVRIDVP